MQSGREAEAEQGEAEAVWPFAKPLSKRQQSDRRGHNNDCHLRMCRTWRRLGDIGKLHKQSTERVRERGIKSGLGHCVCVFITEMSNYLTKDLRYKTRGAGQGAWRVCVSCLLINSSRGKHVKVSRAWR